MSNLWDKEPVLITGLVQAAIILAIAFGAHLSTEQTAAILGFVSAALMIVGACVSRSQVQPTSGATVPDVVSPETLNAINHAPSSVDVAVKSISGVKSVLVMVGLSLLLAGSSLSLTGCGASIKTGVSATADVANAGGKLEDSANIIFKAAQGAQVTGLIPATAVDTTALAVNKIGHLGKDLGAALVAYTNFKNAGGDVTVQRTAILADVAAIEQALADIGKAIPNKTIAAIDTAVADIITVITFVKGQVTL